MNLQGEDTDAACGSCRLSQEFGLQVKQSLQQVITLALPCPKTICTGRDGKMLEFDVRVLILLTVT